MNVSKKNIEEAKQLNGDKMVRDVFFPENRKLNMDDKLDIAIAQLSQMMVSINSLVHHPDIRKDKKVVEIQEASALRFCGVREFLEEVYLERQAKKEA